MILGEVKSSNGAFLRFEARLSFFEFLNEEKIQSRVLKL